MGGSVGCLLSQHTVPVSPLPLLRSDNIAFLAPSTQAPLAISTLVTTESGLGKSPLAAITPLLKQRH